MISREQQERALSEFRDASSKTFAAARSAELDLEDYTYRQCPYDPAVRASKLIAFNEADYQAESRAWIASLIRKAIMEPTT